MAPWQGQCLDQPHSLARQLTLTALPLHPPTPPPADPAAYAHEVRQLADAASALVSAAAAQGDGGGPGLQSVVCSTPETYPNRMWAPRKRRRMTPAAVDAYNAAAAGALGEYLRPRGPLRLLDLQALTHQCGEECSVDGVHSAASVYTAALQLLLNQLRQGLQPHDARPA